jgi:steroid 5-alpha reductase family enzyme
MVVMWLISIPLKNAAVIDLVWGAGFAVIAWITFEMARADGRLTSDVFTTPAAWLLPVLTTMWGVRLSVYLAWRNWGQPEDKRYAAMREKRGDDFWWQSLLIVFLLQAGLMWIVSLPLQFGIPHARVGWTWLHPIGLALFSTGLVFETIGDWQLARFKSRPENAGAVLDRGLWRYTRHPNYFGDFCVWWGLYTIAISHGEHLWTFVGPLLMSVLLMRISGVTLLEKSMSQKPGFSEYARRTSAFFPWPPAAANSRGPAK